MALLTNGSNVNEALCLAARARKIVLDSCARVMFDYIGQEREMTAFENEIVAVIKQDDSGWFWCRSRDGKREGFLPSEYLEFPLREQTWEIMAETEEKQQQRVVKNFEEQSIIPVFKSHVVVQVAEVVLKVFFFKNFFDELECRFWHDFADEKGLALLKKRFSVVLI
jgi:hypothetical protein